MSLVEGYLYLITNSAWPGWIKVGTTKNIKHRVRSYQTGSPFRDYQVVYSVKHPPPDPGKHKNLHSLQQMVIILVVLIVH